MELIIAPHSREAIARFWYARFCGRSSLSLRGKQLVILAPRSDQHIKFTDRSATLLPGD
jgi:hypothetical protein